MTLPLIPATEDHVKAIFSALSIEEDRHRRMVEVFKDWIKSELHLPHDVDDSYLSSFIFLCKDDLAKAKSKFEGLIIMRKNQYSLSHEEFLTVEDFVQLQIASLNVVLPKLTQDGYRVSYVSFSKSAKDFDIKKYFKFWTALADIALFQDRNAGLIVITDFANCTVDIASKFDFTSCAQFAVFMLRTFPLRLKNYHAINVPPAAKPVLGLVKSLFPAKMKDRMIIHNEVRCLKKYLEEDFIPIGYGGTLHVDGLAAAWQKYYLENQEWKEKARKLTLRGEIPKEKTHLNPSDGFGTEGTFRNLQVD